MSDLDALAKLDRFRKATKSNQAEMLVWLLSRRHGNQSGVGLSAVAEGFAQLELVKPNLTRIRASFRVSRNIRSLGQDQYAPAREFSIQMEDLLPQPMLLPADMLDLDSIALPPFVSGERKSELSQMVRAYAHLFLLENSMRGLIEKTLREKLGEDWWDQASNAGMRKKHSDRIQNESSKKWAPARSDFGPLYALDWSDLITLMRKYESEFLPHIKDINFLHRFEDAGTYRNVVAHNGIFRDSDDFNLIRIYYRDWIKQLS